MPGVPLRACNPIQFTTKRHATLRHWSALPLVRETRVASIPPNASQKRWSPLLFPSCISLSSLKLVPNEAPALQGFVGR